MLFRQEERRGTKNDKPSGDGEIGWIGWGSPRKSQQPYSNGERPDKN
jgi:hypothetical protein